MNLTIHRGTPADYARFARHHYRAPAPAVIDLVLLARIGNRPVGILIISRPVLNAPWRAAAWGDAFTGPPYAVAAEVNATVRTIARVIVDPRHRARGIATALVRAYLAAPLSPRTEAIAAMGRACPFFERAGMRPIRTRPARRALALRKLLQHLRLPPWRLVHIEHAAAALRAHPELCLALRRWGNDSRATRTAARQRRLTELAVLAAASLAAPPRVYIAQLPPQ